MVAGAIARGYVGQGRARARLSSFPDAEMELASIFLI